MIGDKILGEQVAVEALIIDLQPRRRVDQAEAYPIVDIAGDCPVAAASCRKSSGDNLISRTLALGAPDNVTAVLVDILPD